MLDFCRSAAPALVVMMMTIAEIGLASVVIGQRPMIHDLQQDVEYPGGLSRFHPAAARNAVSC